jgi:putative FmdB family regulatory protein
MRSDAIVRSDRGCSTSLSIESSGDVRARRVTRRGGHPERQARSVHVTIARIEREGATMPTYEFRCRSCGEIIERTMHVDEHDKARASGIPCPRCASKDVVPQIAPFEVRTSRKAS